MKRITALITALLILVNLFAISVSASEVSITTLYPGDKTSYKDGDAAVITGTCTAGKDIVIRIYDEKKSLIYTDVITAPENTTGSFEFSGFNIPETSSKGELKYTVVVSQEQDGDETTNIDTRTITINPGVKPDPDPKPDKIVIDGWVPKKPDEEKNNEIPAHVDPINPDGGNDKLWDTVGSVNNVTDAEKAIKSITKQTATEDMQDETAKNNVAVAGETMIANIGAKKVTVGKSNKLVLDHSTVTANDLSKLDNTTEAIEKAIKSNDISLNREMQKELVLTVNFNKKTVAEIAISKSLVEKLEKADVDILSIKDADFKVSYTMDELKSILGDKEETILTIDKSGMTKDTKKIAVTFDTDSTQTMKIAFPGLDGDTKYMAVVDEEGNPVGGRYNSATGDFEAKISESGVYTVVNNEKDFDDIKNLSEEMQESIKILASKGIIEGTSEKEFSPEKSISRAEVAALLLRVISQVDPNADGQFADVKKSDWFYGTAGSAKKYGMIVGFEDNTFRGNQVIAKDQILTIASRILQKEMKYKVPEKTSEWLKFSDNDTIAEWAKEHVALTTMANIITRTTDNTIKANEEMTRGDAALIIMRLFYKIW